MRAGGRGGNVEVDFYNLQTMERCLRGLRGTCMLIVLEGNVGVGPRGRVSCYDRNAAWRELRILTFLLDFEQRTLCGNSRAL